MAQPGNKNATKNRRWAQSIDKAIKRYNDGDVKAGEALDMIAERLVKQALYGEAAEFKDAIKEIGDRIDGKALAEVNITGGLDINGLADKDLDQRIEELRGSSIPGPENRTH